MKSFLDGKILGPNLADKESIYYLACDWTIVSALWLAHCETITPLLSREEFIKRVNGLADEFEPDIIKHLKGSENV